jgi:hypothetical protein
VVAHKQRVSTRSKPVASNDPQVPKHFIPTLRQFLQVEDGNHFMGVAGHDSGQEVETLAEWPTSVLLHPEIFICLEGAKEIRARETALIIIRAIIQSYDPAETQRNGSNSTNSDPPEAQRNRSNSSHSEEKKAKKPTTQKLVWNFHYQQQGAIASLSVSGQSQTEWGPRQTSTTPLNQESPTHACSTLDKI